MTDSVKLCVRCAVRGAAMGFVSMEGYDGPEPSRVGSQPLPGQDCGGDEADSIVWSSRSSRATESTEPLLQHNTTRPSRSDHTRRDHTSALQVLLLGILVIPIRGEAQITPLLLEVRGGAWIPTANLVGAQGFEGEASADVSFGVHFVLKSGLISYVAGFSEHRFGCTQVQCGEAVDFVSTAWDLGVRVNLRQAGIVAVGEPGVRARLFSLLTSKPGMTWQRRAPTEAGDTRPGQGFWFRWEGRF